MTRGWLAYTVVGLCTTGVCLLGFLHVLRSGQMKIHESKPHRLVIVYVSMFISAVQSGICWPIYWFGFLVAKLGDLLDNDDMEAQ